MHDVNIDVCIAQNVFRLNMLISILKIIPLFVTLNTYVHHIYRSISIIFLNKERHFILLKSIRSISLFGDSPYF
jgi:hypothetical protein